MSMLQREPFPETLREALDVLAEQAALALDHIRVLEESRTPQGLATELTSARDSAALLDALVERMTDAVGADACAVWLFEGPAMRLVPRAARGFSAGFFDRVAQYTATPGAFADLRRDQSPLHFSDLPAVIRRRDPAAADAYAAEGIVSSLRLPLFAPGERLIGLPPCTTGANGGMERTRCAWRWPLPTRSPSRCTTPA
jgi:GAF domain-containing protein